MSDRPVVALLGTGTMGSGMARSVARACLPIRVWNRSPARAEALADVARICTAAGEAVSGADVVITMLYDTDSVIEVMSALGADLAPGTIWLQQSTVGVAGTDRLIALAEDLGVRFVDAPVLGTKQPAAEGTLVVLASGPPDVREDVAPVLDAIGSRTMWVGPAGAGSRLKLGANAWVATLNDAIAESLTLTRDLGLDPALFLEAVRGGAVDAPYVQLKGGAMLSGRHDPAFAAAAALKDSGLILDAAHASGTDLGLMPIVRNHLERAIEAGHGDLDMSAVYLIH